MPLNIMKEPKTEAVNGDKPAGTSGRQALIDGLNEELADETRHKEELERIVAGWYETAPGRRPVDDPLQDTGGEG